MSVNRSAFGIVIAVSLAGLAGCQTKSIVGNDHSVMGAVQVCSSCHGMSGRSTNQTFPNLAGQQKDYLEAQLKAFRDRTRADPHARTYMFGMAAKLTDGTIDGLAAYFARQRPAEPVLDGDAAAIARGAAIFKNGITAENVPPCFACHGDKAEGNGEVPRLADQHPRYILEQLRAFRQNARANDIMHANTQGMTDDQMRDVAAFVASL